MDHKALLDLRLAQNLVLSSLPPAARARIAAAAVVRSYPRGEILAAEQEHSDTFLLILEGSAEVCRTSEDGKTTIFRTLQPPVGVGFLLLSGEPHTANIVAQEGLLVARIPVAVLKAEFTSRPELLYKVITGLTELIDSLSSELMEQRTLPVVERVRLATYRNADQNGILHMSHEELAQCVGATRANTTRALKQLEAAGTISLERRTIRIKRNG